MNNYTLQQCENCAHCAYDIDGMSKCLRTGENVAFDYTCPDWESFVPTPNYAPSIPSDFDEEIF